MKIYRYQSDSFLTIMLVVLNFLPIYATRENTLKYTHYWRVCNSSWNKADFGLDYSAPNVKVTATWAYNYDTGITNHIWSVTNATKNILQINSTSASPKIILGIYGPKTGNWKVGTCSYTNIPIGTQPFNIDLEWMR